MALVSNSAIEQAHAHEPSPAAVSASSTVEQHSIGHSVVLHLLPGLLVTIFYALAAPVARALGYPALVALYLAIVVVLIPFELGYLFVQARQRNGRLSLDHIVLYRKSIARLRFVLLVLGLFFWSGLIFALASITDQPIIDRFFGWVPAWFFLGEDLSAYSRPALLVTVVFGLVVNGVAGPVVEELYFRGYLLPRLSRLGGWAPLVNVVLFSLYHFFTPLAKPWPHSGVLTDGVRGQVAAKCLSGNGGPLPRQCRLRTRAAARDPALRPLRASSANASAALQR